MALTFNPEFHVQIKAGLWTRVVSGLIPFGARPSLEQERRVFQEADRIEAEGERVVAIDFKSDSGVPKSTKMEG